MKRERWGRAGVNFYEKKEENDPIEQVGRWKLEL